MPRYERRIATRITRDADARLRLTALVTRRRISALAHRRHECGPLQPADELAERLRDTEESTA